MLENWRPISLLNVDTKIMSEVIASKLKIIKPVSVIKDRYIGETVPSVFDIMEISS